MDDFYVNIVVDSEGSILKVFKDFDDALSYIQKNSSDGNSLYVRVYKLL